MGGSVEAMVDEMIKDEKLNGAKYPKRPDGACPLCWTGNIQAMRERAASGDGHCVDAISAHFLKALEYFGGKTEREAALAFANGVSLKEHKQRSLAEDENRRLAAERDQLKADRDRDAQTIWELKDELRRLGRATDALTDEVADLAFPPPPPVPPVDMIDLVAMAQQAEGSGDAPTAKELYHVVAAMADRAALALD